jgi:hypothetical protein
MHGSFEAFPTGTKFPTIRPFRIMFGRDAAAPSGRRQSITDPGGGGPPDVDLLRAQDRVQ